MKRTLVPIGESYEGFYYGLKKVGLENGKAKYEFDTQPVKFKFKQTNISGSAVFTSSKGYQRTNQTLGGVMMTEYGLFRIQTSDSFVPFQINGLVKIKINQVWKSFTIVKLTTLGDGSYVNNINREGYFDMAKAPIVIELN